MIALLTWYNLNTPHAAYWHNQTPRGFPITISQEHFACACPKQYPFGTKFLFYRPDTDQYATATCLDRTKSGTDFDAWPALAKSLSFGPTFKNDPGRVKVQIWPLNTRR